MEILDDKGNVIPGLAKSDCKVVTGDNCKAKVEWTSGKTLASLKGQKIKVRFYLTDGDLYAFWISPESTGESQGYTAGGGPNLNKSGIDKK